MRRVAAWRPGRRERSGKYLILLAPILPVMLAMTGLTLDAGSLLAVRRQAQNAADAAALAAAQDLLRAQDLGSASTPETAAGIARSSVHTNNQLPDSTVDVRIPPATGPYQGLAGYVEIIVTVPLRTAFIQIVGVDPNQSATARAVAGFEQVDSQNQIVLLDPTASPALDVQGTTLDVAGSISVNSLAGGVDENGDKVDFGIKPSAVVTGSRGIIKASDVQVAGGVDHPGNFQNSGGGTSSPLDAGTQQLVKDDLRNVPTPTTGNGVNNTFPNPDGSNAASPPVVNQPVSAGQNLTLRPGIYSSISVLGAEGSTVTFQPGIYVLKGNPGTALQIVSAGSVVGKGVLFYNTGSDYNAVTGSPDRGDVASPGTTIPNAGGGITIRAKSLELTGLDPANGPFGGMLIYQRRANGSTMAIIGQGNSNRIAGTIYARGAAVAVFGSANYQIQIVSNSLFVRRSDLGSDTQFQPAPLAFRPPKIFLVE